MSQPLSIGIVCFPSFGGSGVVGAELALGLAERGHEVHLIASALPNRIEGARHPRLHFHEVRVPDYPLFEHAPYELAVASRIYEIGMARKLDLVQVHYAVPHAGSGILARHLLGKRAFRLVTSLHGTDVTHVGTDPSYRAIVGATVAASDGVTVPSEWLREQARSNLGLGAEIDIEVIGNFVDTDRFAPPTSRDPSILRRLFPQEKEEGPILFHVSNFRPVKRTVDLVEVLAMLRRRLAARLVLVGDGPERERVEARAHELGLCGSVRFLGTQVDFADALRHADAFLLPSESESFGLAALEAMSSGVPVFGYRVGGLPEVVTPEVGRLVERGDVDALSHSVMDVFTESGARDALGSAARTRAVEHFRREPALDGIERYFRRVVSQPKREG